MVLDMEIAGVDGGHGHRAWAAGAGRGRSIRKRRAKRFSTRVRCLRVALGKFGSVFGGAAPEECRAGWPAWFGLLGLLGWLGWLGWLGMGSGDGYLAWALSMGPGRRF